MIRGCATYRKSIEIDRGRLLPLRTEAQSAVVRLHCLKDNERCEDVRELGQRTEAEGRDDGRQERRNRPECAVGREIHDSRCVDLAHGRPSVPCHRLDLLKRTLQSMNAAAICSAARMSAMYNGRSSSTRTSLEHSSHVRFGPPIASFQCNLPLLLVEYVGLFRTVWKEGEGCEGEQDRGCPFDEEQEFPGGYADMRVLYAERHQSTERPCDSSDTVVGRDAQPDLVACVEQC